MARDVTSLENSNRAESPSLRALQVHAPADLVRELRRIGLEEHEWQPAVDHLSYQLFRLDNLSRDQALQFRAQAFAAGLHVSYPGSTDDDQNYSLVVGGSLAAYDQFVTAIKHGPVDDLADQFEEALRHVPGRGNAAALEAGRHYLLRGAGVAPRPIRLPDGRFLEFGHKTYVMGILNITPDSFTEDGVMSGVDDAVNRAHELVASGADILDIGGESTEARSEGTLSPEAELERVLLVVKALVSEDPELVISVDTRRANVARAVLNAGAHIINDVTAGLDNDDLVRVVAETQAPLVIMHHQWGIDVYRDLMSDMTSFFRERLRALARAGVNPEQVIIDTGFGFSQDLYHDLESTWRLGELRVLGRPLLLAHSNKATIGRVLGVPDEIEPRVMGNVAAAVVGITHGVDIVRVHEVAQVAVAVRMADALVRGYTGPREKNSD